MKKMLTAAALLALLPLAAEAGQPFEAAAFAQAQDAGKAILVDVTAPWCPTCAKQKPVIESLEQSQPGLVVFDIDFDSGKEALRQFGVRSQSTLIVFRGKTEVARSTGETRPDAIRGLMAKAL